LAINANHIDFAILENVQKLYAFDIFEPRDHAGDHGACLLVFLHRISSKSDRYGPTFESFVFFRSSLKRKINVPHKIRHTHILHSNLLMFSMCPAARRLDSSLFSSCTSSTSTIIVPASHRISVLLGNEAEMICPHHSLGTHGRTKRLGKSPSFCWPARYEQFILCMHTAVMRR
jgi:hypothetical protein